MWKHATTTMNHGNQPLAQTQRDILDKVRNSGWLVYYEFPVKVRHFAPHH
jgi:hypothetical protein